MTKRPPLVAALLWATVVSVGGFTSASNAQQSDAPATDAPAEATADGQPAAAGDDKPISARADPEAEVTSAPDEKPASDANADPDDPTADAPLSSSAKAQLSAVRAIENRLAAGEEINADERAFLFAAAKSEASPRVRAAAMTVLPWLTPTISMPPLLAGADDPDPLVQASALRALVSIAWNMPEPQKAVGAQLAARFIDAPSDEVACQAARLFAATDKDAAITAIEARADDLNDVRYGCFREIATLPMRTIEVERPQLKKPKKVATIGEDGVKTQDPVDDDNSMLGSGVFIGTAASTGLMLGGLLPRAFIQPRDTLTYRRRTTIFAREEPSLILGASAALGAGTLAGAGAFGLTWLAGDIGFAPAVADLMMTTAGAAAGLGVGLAFGIPEPWGSLSIMGTTALGLGAGTAMGYLLPASFNDLTMMATTAMHFALAAGLLTFAIVPVGTPLLFERVLRLDFGVGIGLMGGAAGATLGLGLSPFLDISHGRMLAASGAALAVTSSAVALTYLVIPVNIVVRGRIASGVGLGLGAIASMATFFLIPDSWARIFEHARPTKTNGAVAVEDGEVKAGLPTMWVRPSDVSGQQSMAMGINLLGIRW